MPSPFPGMDPYLEDPELWRDVHHELISQIRQALNPLLRPRYIARVELRIYVSGENTSRKQDRFPDVRMEARTRRTGRKKAASAGALQVAEPEIVPLLFDPEIEEARLEISEHETGSLITVIEVMNPTNKLRSSAGRASFMAKRLEVLASAVHWVEIDLLRAGLPATTSPPLRACDYRILVSRGDDRLHTRFWAVSIRQPLPVISIPLKEEDPDVPLDLGAVLRSAYDIAEYDASIDYRKPPVPPLKPADAKWANALLRQQGLR